MAGHGTRCGDAGERMQLLDPAVDASIQHGNVSDEQQIPEPERACLYVVDREIVVGVRGAMRIQAQQAITEIELERVAHRRGGHDQIAVRERVPALRRRAFQVGRRALREGACEPDVADVTRMPAVAAMLLNAQSQGAAALGQLR